MNTKINLLFAILILLNSFIVSAEPVIIYDNITSSQYKTITIQDDLNYAYLTDYKYDVYVNNQFIGKYAKDEPIEIPDNSSIMIYVPAPISTDYSTAWDIGKTYFAIAIMGLSVLILIVFIIIYLYKKSLRRV